MAVRQDDHQFIQFALQSSSLALLYYDYMLTFSNEVEYIWKSRVRWSNVLYILCRYAMLGNVLFLLAILGVVDNCNAWYEIVGSISILGRMGIMTVMTIRTYVIWGKNLYVGLSLGFLEVVCIALSAAKVPGSLCVGSPAEAYHDVQSSLTTLVLIFDLFVTVLTVVRGFQVIRRRISSGSGYRDSVMFFILEQGLLYFSGIFGLQLASIILLHKAPGGFLQRLLNALTLPLSGLLTARFLLDLRSWTDRQDNGTLPYLDPESPHPGKLEFSHTVPDQNGTFQDFGLDLEKEYVVRRQETIKEDVTLENRSRAGPSRLGPSRVRHIHTEV
ncbi:hypothetical protein DL96DRAFT_1590958 [Flagelloscypha sp. PMI_526]|nr:hypothetical protein DL96DRAFT_1590958 [Flagelloscypha sp. PMI_526]